MGVKLLLEKAHVEGIRFYDAYRREGGYRSVEKALKMGPEAIVGRSEEKRLAWPWWCRFSCGYEMEFYCKT
jgi:NADH-quinone oxidoreductase subunit F